MSQEHIDMWRATAAAWDQRYNAIAEDQWQSATPCEGWDVRALVDHAVEVQVGFAGAMVGADIPEGAQWPAISAAISAALDNPGALEGTSQGPMGEMPKTVMFGIASSDLLIHTWDLARAIGADEQLPAEAVAACHNGLKRFPPDMMRAPGRFASEVDCGPDADAQTQMLSFSGRQV